MAMLVTGGMGAIGNHVLNRLAALELAAVSYDVMSEPLGRLDDRVRAVRGDVTDMGHLVDVIRSAGVDTIMHLAAALGDYYDEHPLLSVRANLEGTITVLEAARVCGVKRVVAASTFMIYPEESPHRRKGVPVTEDHPPEPDRPYSILKYAIERLGLFYHNRHGLEFAACRFASYYGAERAMAIARRGRMAHILNELILRAVQGERVDLPQGGDALIDAIYVKDLADAVVSLATSDRFPGYGVYNVGGGKYLTLREVADVLNKLFPQAAITIGPGERLAKRAGHLVLLDISKIRREIGWAPRYDFAQGAADCGRELASLLR